MTNTLLLHVKNLRRKKAGAYIKNKRDIYVPSRVGKSIFLDKYLAEKKPSLRYDKVEIATKVRNSQMSSLHFPWYLNSIYMA